MSLSAFPSGRVLNADMVRSMAKDPVIFALATPIPEIMPEEARQGGARVMVFNRADFPNQSDVAMIFPGFFRGDPGQPGQQYQ